MDKFRSLLNILQSHQAILEIGLVALLTAGGEHLFSVVVFKCPCNSWNLSYGTVFLLVPALALLVLGFFLRGRTWELCTGRCDLEFNCAFFQECMLIVATASVAPVSWIAFALLNGIFYECARTGLADLTVFFTDHPCSGKPQQCVGELHKFPCAESTVTVPPGDRHEVLEIIRAESQVIGWLLIASIICGALLYKSVARCCSPISYMQLRFLQVYARKERDLLERLVAEHAEKLAERNLMSFFQQTPPEPFSTPGEEAWKKVSSFFRLSEESRCQNELQTYVSDISNERDTAF